MAGNNDDFLDWAPLGLAIWPLLLILIFIWEAFNLYWRRSKASKILSRGGPKSKQEFIFLFPGACEKCLSRDLVRVEYEYVERGELGLGRPLVTEKGEYTECMRCHHFMNGGCPNWPRGDHSSRRTKKRVYSPYISPERSETVRDLTE